MSVLIGDRYGQLGNRLWTYAQFVAFGVSHGITVLNPYFADYARDFVGTMDNPLCRFPARESRTDRVFAGSLKVFAPILDLLIRVLARSGIKLPRVQIRRLVWGEFLDLEGPSARALARPRQLVVVHGWGFRNRTGLAEHREEIKRFFRPVPRVEERVDRFLADARAGADLLVGVHVRRGDYREHLGGRYFFSVDEYRRVMQEVVGDHRGSRVRFLVCSDEQQPSGSFPDLDVVFGPGDTMGDLVALAGCDLLIAPPSSFSLWASYYGEVPLFMVVSSGARPTRDAFVTAPNFFFDEVDHLY